MDNLQAEIEELERIETEHYNPETEDYIQWPRH